MHAARFQLNYRRFQVFSTHSFAHTMYDMGTELRLFDDQMEGIQRAHMHKKIRAAVALT